MELLSRLCLLACKVPSHPLSMCHTHQQLVCWGQQATGVSAEGRRTHTAGCWCCAHTSDRTRQRSGRAPQHCAPVCISYLGRQAGALGWGQTLAGACLRVWHLDGFCCSVCVPSCPSTRALSCHCVPFLLCWRRDTLLLPPPTTTTHPHLFALITADTPLSRRCSLRLLLAPCHKAVCTHSALHS